VNIEVLREPAGFGGNLGFVPGVNDVSLNIEQKKAIVTELAEVARTAHAAVAAEYAGLTVAQLTQLRVNARQAGVYLRVVRNTLARRALEDTSFACMRDGLVGPLILAFSQEDPGAAGRVIDEFSRTNDKLIVKLVSVGGKSLGPAAIKQLATMPTREQALSLLMAALQAPITQFVRTLAEPHSRLVRTVGAIRDQKQAA
jgi:large subunit ribosomal protein L10